MSTLTIVLIVLGALAVGVTGGEVQARLDKDDSVAEAVVAPVLAHEDTVQQVTEIDRARWVCEGEHYDQAACMAVLLCSQVAGGTVQPSACDAAVNRWVSQSGWTTCGGDKACLDFEGRRK